MISEAVFVLLSTIGPTNAIDTILSKTWTEAKVTPAPIASDTEFLRRVTLDLAGRIPTLGEIEDFERSPDRSAKIDALLASDEFARAWAEHWATILVGYAEEEEFDRRALKNWLEQSISGDVGYDEMVRRMIGGVGLAAERPELNFLVRHHDEPAQKISRTFLGVRLDCARCHDHPYDRWTSEDSEHLERFFEPMSLERFGGSVRVDDEIPELDEPPRFLTGAKPRTNRWRRELALFLTRSKPFARAFANRVWYLLMGRGIVDPPDDFHAEREPASAELLEYLAKRSRDSNWRMKELVREICHSDVYQRTSRGEADEECLRLFAQRTVRPLTPFQMLTSATMAFERSMSRRKRIEFLERISPEERDRDPSNFWDYRERAQDILTLFSITMPRSPRSLEEAYLRTLGRRPTARERSLCDGHSLAAVTFALIHSNEFRFNH